MKPLLTVLLVVVPRLALACPVCFGENDSPMAASINQGIWAMLGVTGAVLVAFASFFVHLIRRARMVQASEGIQTESRHESGGAVRLDPDTGDVQGGTI